MDKSMQELWSKASNAPAPSHNASHHQLITAISKGFAPLIAEYVKEQLAALRAENAALKQRLDALEERLTIRRVA